jgi:hypothetical protein
VHFVLGDCVKVEDIRVETMNITRITSHLAGEHVSLHIVWVKRIDDDVYFVDGLMTASVDLCQ